MQIYENTLKPSQLRNVNKNILSDAPYWTFFFISPTLNFLTVVFFTLHLRSCIYKRRLVYCAISQTQIIVYNILHQQAFSGQTQCMLSLQLFSRLSVICFLQWCQNHFTDGVTVIQLTVRLLIRLSDTQSVFSCTLFLAKSNSTFYESQSVTTNCYSHLSQTNAVVVSELIKIGTEIYRMTFI